MVYNSKKLRVMVYNSKNLRVMVYSFKKSLYNNSKLKGASYVSREEAVQCQGTHWQLPVDCQHQLLFANLGPFSCEVGEGFRCSKKFCGRAFSTKTLRMVFERPITL